MAYALTIPIVLEPSDVGLTLSAQLRDTAGNAVGGAVTSGFVEAGLGMYYWTYASFPDGHRGVVEFSASSVLQAIVAINPEEAEYTNAKTSALLTTAMTEAYAADGAAPTLAQAVFLIMQRLTEFSISSTTITVKKLDGSTTAALLTLDSSSAPTSSTRSG